MEITSKINKVSVKNAESISQDVDYQNYISDFHIFLAKKKDVEIVKKFMKRNDLNEVELNIFAKALGFFSKNEFYEYSKLQAARVKKVNDRFGILSNSKLALTNFVENTLIPYDSKSTIHAKVMVAPADGGEDTGGKNCAAKLRNCIAIATSAAVIAHLTCTTIDIATAGIGFFICHGAVVVAHSAANSNCGIAYDECMDSSPQT